MNLQPGKLVVKSIGAWVLNNSTTILTAVNSLGVVATAISSGHATTMAIRILEEGRKEGAPPLTFKEKVKKTWKCYIPTAVLGAATIATGVKSNSLSLKKSAALTGLYTLSETTLNEYRAKVAHEIGSSKELKIRDSVAADKVARAPVPGPTIIAGEGTVLAYEAMNEERPFYISIEGARKAMNDINYRMITKMEMYASLNEFYEALGISGIELGEESGWNADNPIDLIFSSTLKDGKPAVFIDYRCRAFPDYRR
jgi:hypothetical protein